MTDITLSEQELHRERPILLSAPMVRALLAGTKTQTRRVVADSNSRGNMKASELRLYDKRTFVDKGPSPAGNPGQYLHAYVNAEVREANRGWQPGDCDPSIMERLYPWVFPGDRLWVRETWRSLAAFNTRPPRDIPNNQLIWYEAQDAVPFHPSDFGKLRPGMFMPRWASRITLEVTEVRVERLQDISEVDAIAEGLVSRVGRGGHTVWGLTEWGDNPSLWNSSAVQAYRALWALINGAGAWDLNPWVWCVSFRKLP